MIKKTLKMKNFTEYQVMVLNKIGIDKLLHYLVGALIPALVSPLGIWFTVGGAVLIIVLNFIKEKWLDSIAEYNDLYACILGSLTTILINILYLIL